MGPSQLGIFYGAAGQALGGPSFLLEERNAGFHQGFGATKVQFPECPVCAPFVPQDQERADKLQKLQAEREEKGRLKEEAKAAKERAKEEAKKRKEEEKELKERERREKKEKEEKEKAEKLRVKEEKRKERQEALE